MLKRVLMIALIAGSATAVACKSEVDNKPAATVEEPATGAEAAEGEEGAAAEGEEAAGEEAAAAGTVDIDTANSKIEFVGAKVTGDHTGGFNTWNGTATLGEDGNLSGLEFTVDTTSVYSDNEKLTGHLKSPDFFDVAKYPKATFKTTKIETLEGEGGTHTITGDMDLRGVKKTISFPATVKKEGDKITANTEFTLKRFDFGIEYKGQADDLIKDEVLMKINLAIPAKPSEG